VTAPAADTPAAPGDLLAPEPAVRTGALIGYARVSTSGQLLDRQQHALAEAGCFRIFADKLSGKNADRPELAACLDYLRPGDTLVVPSLDRLSRSLADLIAIVTTLRRHGVGFKSLHEALDTTTPGGRLVFHVFATLAEFIRELIVEGSREGLDAARARGACLGRPPAMTAEQVRHARDLLTRPDNTVRLPHTGDHDSEARPLDRDPMRQGRRDVALARKPRRRRRDRRRDRGTGTRCPGRPRQRGARHARGGPDRAR